MAGLDVTMSTEPAWHEKYPQPRTEVPKSISKETFLARLKSGENAGVSFLLVDLRRNDYEVHIRPVKDKPANYHKGGTIRGSLNLPAQTLYLSLNTLLNLCKAAGVRDVIWYCGKLIVLGKRRLLTYGRLISRKGHQSSLLVR